MSQSASQAAAFYRDVAANGRMWTICDDGGYPAPKTSSGRRAMPFWSTKARAEKIVATVPAYAGFVVEEVEWRAFQSKWAPDLTRDDCLIGVNWSGASATGYDLSASDVVANIQALTTGGDVEKTVKGWLSKLFDR